MISATTPTTPADVAADPGVRLRGLAKSFRGPLGPVRAVHDLDLSIAPGETVALLGPNGAGKTTTVDMMLGLLPPDAGTVSLFGLDPRRAVDAGLVGAMLQTGALLRELTVRELVSMMASLYPRPRDVDEVVALAGIEDVAARRTHRLSGGETQRVRFALALVSDPRLLVLDEPTVAMDVEARHGFWSIMRRIARGGTTVVFATHYLEEADAFADRVVLMARGAIVADGTAAEIKARVGLRVIRATVPGADLGALGALPGVESVERRGDRVTLTCTSSDDAVRALLRAESGARDIEIAGAGLEEAFLRLTGDEEDR